MIIELHSRIFLHLDRLHFSWLQKLRGDPVNALHGEKKWSQHEYEENTPVINQKTIQNSNTHAQVKTYVKQAVASERAASLNVPCHIDIFEPNQIQFASDFGSAHFIFHVLLVCENEYSGLFQILRRKEK